MQERTYRSYFFILFQNNTNKNNKISNIWNRGIIKFFTLLYLYHLYFDDNHLRGRVKCLRWMSIWKEGRNFVFYITIQTDRNIENTSKENFNIQLLRIPMTECMYYIKSVTYARVKNWRGIRPADRSVRIALCNYVPHCKYSTMNMLANTRALCDCKYQTWRRCLLNIEYVTFFKMSIDFLFLS